MSSAARHRKALRTILILAACLAVPFYALWRVHSTDILAGMGSYGHVPEFLYPVENEGVGYSHFDAMKHLSVLFILRDHSAGQVELARQEMRTLNDWLTRQLVVHDTSQEEPPAIKKFLMSEAWEGTVPKGWGYIRTDASTPFLVPDAFRQDKGNALVLVDDSGRYRAYLPAGSTDGMAKAQRLLSKMASQQNLLFYLTNQTLMWEKAKRVARGLEPYPSH